MAAITARDRQLARRLPGEFLTCPGGPKERVVEIVDRSWGSYDTHPTTELAQALLPVLEELAEPGREVTDRHRDLDEDIG